MAKAAKKTKTVAMGIQRHGAEFGGTRPKLVVVADNTTTKNKKESTAQRKQMLVEAKKIIISGSCVIGSAYYDLGEAFKNVLERNLFEDDGRATFREFCKSVDYSYQMVLNLIAVAENLTREQAKQFGPTMSYAIARASSKEAQEKLIQMASGGAKTREVAEASKELRRAEGKGRFRTAQSASKGSKGGKQGQGKGKTSKASVATKADLGSKQNVEEFDKKVAEVAKGQFSCKQSKGCLLGSFEVDGLQVQLSIDLKSKKASYEIKMG